MRKNAWRGAIAAAVVCGIVLICVLANYDAVRSSRVQRLSGSGMLSAAGSIYSQTSIYDMSAWPNAAGAEITFVHIEGSCIDCTAGNSIYVVIVAENYNDSAFKEDLVAGSLPILADDQLVSDGVSSSGFSISYVPPASTTHLNLFIIGFNKNTKQFNSATIDYSSSGEYGFGSAARTAAVFALVIGLIIGLIFLMTFAFVSFRKSSKKKTPATTPITPEAEVEQRKRLTPDKLKMLERLMQVSSRVLIDDMAAVLEVPRAELLRKLVELADSFHFKIEENLISFETGVDVGNLVKELDAQFVSWEKSAEKVK